MDDINVTPVLADSSTVENIPVRPQRPAKTAADWVRDMRMSPEVNKTTVGVETDRITPDLLMATSSKLLGISRREQDPDPKDSLLFQRFYGPAEYFAEHVLRDGGKVARNLLWKATNRGKIDFVPSGALDQHISDVFYTSKLAQMIDGSSPLETVDASFKTTRVGEGGVADVQSAPDEMRTVQASYFGYLDPVRSAERLKVGLDMYMTKNVLKGSDGKLYQRFINARTGKEELVDSVTAAKSVVAAPEMMDADTKSVFALGGRTGVRIVPKDQVDYYLPRADDAYSTASNLVAMPNGVKEMRLLMGCLHPGTPLVTISSKNEITITPAKSIGKNAYGVPGCDNTGKSTGYLIRNSIAKFPQKRKWFKKVVLLSGRSMITSYDHRWPVLRDNSLVLVHADKLQPGDQVLRSSFKDLPNRRTFMRGVLVNKDVATLLGCIVRSVTQPEPGKLRVVYQPSQKTFIDAAIKRLKLEGSHFYANAGDKCLAIHDAGFIQWIEKEICIDPEERRVPTVILSACLDIASHFIDAYTANPTQVGIDSNEDMWILDIPSMICRDGLALLLARMQTDTLYRDAVRSNGVSLALKLVEQVPTFGDSIVDEVKVILEVEKVPIMIDIDIDDNMYAAANGIITHNSKYPLQAISLLEREAPLVRNLDEATGKDMPTLVGKYLGARFAKQGGTVTAVRKDRIDVVYDDGTKGHVSLYQNFPMNAKGYITNTPVVKAGQSFKKGDILASSNYTDDKGVAAIGKNLRSGWLSWKGGTYEDAVVLSESAAKALTSRTMYKSAVDLDKTVSLGKKNYMAWKPSEYTKEQLEALDDNGIVKPGAVLRRGDPMILAVQTTEPSPGTLGKRVLTDISETWEHDHPGVVTDVVKTRKGVKVYAIVEAPIEVGDKVSGSFGNKGIVSQLGKETPESEAVNDDEKEYSIQRIVPDAMMPLGEDGKPLDLLFSPLGLVSRTNASMIHEALLGKIARKTGKPYVIPAFYKGDLYDLVESQLKQHHISDTEDLTDPYTGKKIPKVLTGVSYIYKLKHQAESKLSARGTDSYTSEGQPGGGGFTGCFPAIQNVMTIHGEQSIATLCEKKIPEYVLTFDGRTWLYKRITDWFTYRSNVHDILHVKTAYNLSTTGNKRIRHSTSLYPTKNHKMYMADLSTKLAGDLKEGDLLAGIGFVPTEAQRQALLGTMMGDSCITLEGNVSCSHSVKQVEYIQFKYDLFKGLGARLSTEYKTSQLYTKTGAPKERTYCRVLSIPRSHFVDEIYAMTTQGRQRVLSKQVLEEMGELGFCLWFLDDGSMYNRTKKKGKLALVSNLATNGFQPEEVVEAVEWLKHWFEVDKGISLKKETLKDGSLAYSIAFSMVVSRKIADMVARNVPASAIPGRKHWLKKYCAEKQATQPAKLHDTVNQLGIVPVPVKSISSYVHDKPGVLDIPVYDFTVEDTHRYTLAGGVLCSNSKRYGTLETSALVGHQAFDTLLDAAMIRGQSNSDFWRSIRTGEIPTIPGEPLVHRKFFAHLTGSGVNVRKTPKGISVFSLSNDDVKELAGPRELKSKDTYEARTFRPIDGGLFGQDLFGPNGDRWAYIQLDEPLPNPVMEEPLARLLRMSTKDFMAVAAGKAEVNGMKSSADIKERLSRINLEAEEKQAKREFKDAPMSKKDAALKRYRDIARMKANEVPPDQYMLDRIPVLPPIYRPVSTHNGLTMVADSNYLYAQMMDARDDMREAKNLPEEYQQQARENLYRSWKELTGMYEPENVKLKNKHVQGLLKWALGSSPKWSAVQRKIIGSTVDTVGRGVIAPDPRLKLNQLGVPVPMALGIFEPFVARAMVKQGYTPVEALKMIKARDKRVMPVLVDVMKHSPVQLNRAPSLHKLNIMGFEPVLVAGHAVKVNPSIVVPFAADFDGDSILNMVEIVIDLNILAKKIEHIGISGLTSLEKAVSCLVEHQKKESTMIAKDQRALYATACAPLCELPTVPGSEVRKSDTVTEWDVQEGFYTYTKDPVTGDTVLAPITKVSRHRGLTMLDCTISQCGAFTKVVTASDDHSLITLNPMTLELEKTKPADAVGRCVPRVRYNAGNDSNICARYMDMGRRVELTYDFGVFIGMMLGDGWVDAVGVVRLACCDRSLQQYILEKYTMEDAPIPMRKNAELFVYPPVEDRFSDKDRARFTLYLPPEMRDSLKSLIGTGAKNKRVPEDCFMASRSHITGILMGLLATDGAVTYSTGNKSRKAATKTIAIHTVSPLLRDGIQELASRIGIRTSATPYKGVNSVETCYAVTLSLEDVAREAKKHPALFRIPMARKQEALEKIVADVLADEGSGTSSNIHVPFPRGLFGEFSYAKVATMCPAVIKARATGHIQRKYALTLADMMEKVDWSQYSVPSYLAKKDRVYRTPKEAETLVKKWIAMVRDEETDWCIVTAVTPSSCTEGWDCTVPGPYTFALFDGTVVQDTANVHAPVSDNARRETYEKMFPERNLISMRNRQILYKPEKEYMQGLYVATRMKKGTNQRPRIFSSVEEARQALRKGIIDIDDPIEIRKQ